MLDILSNWKGIIDGFHNLSQRRDTQEAPLTDDQRWNHPDPRLQRPSRLTQNVDGFDLDLRSSFTNLVEQVVREFTTRSES